MLNISRIACHKIESEPYRWAAIDRLFAPADGLALAASFPGNNFKSVAGYDGEKGYEYRARSLIHMGADRATHLDGLSPEWRQLAGDLLSPAYRQAMTRLTGVDLAAALLEANITEYGPGAWLGPHLDLREKLVTQVLYFNREWNPKSGGCLGILRSPDPSDVAREIVPIVGNSAVLVRSERSWHTVTRVHGGDSQRRAVNIIFHLAGSISTMWPPEEASQSVSRKGWRALVAPIIRKIFRPS